MSDDASSGPAAPTTPRKTPPPAPACPCHHNSWDNVRIKKGINALRCRICQVQWRLHHSQFTRCKKFNDHSNGGCTSDCADLHIHQFKETLAERKERFGNKVLNGVPLQIKCKHIDCDDTDQSENGLSDEPEHASQPAQELDDMLDKFRITMLGRISIG
eukprot:TRINITY_DN1035_c3_g1_i1.p2 TRINITY_DN1035_c3_g1~~TRINITY_DN1035_c3_g1_i1.p2  ORF type:complete len:159 (+),score=30.73 TRINITY_DN1035_c3_g1_i1:56-532(+)